jgi:hypothetical protein
VSGPEGESARHPAEQERLQAAREEELVARLKATRARIDLLAGLVAFTEARWPMLEAEERRRDPCAPGETIAARAQARLQAELKERGLDD